MEQTKRFFEGLHRHDVFGFSRAFTAEFIRRKALESGVHLTTPGKRHPARSDTDPRYIFRVTRVDRKEGRIRQLVIRLDKDLRELKALLDVPGLSDRDSEQIKETETK
jgi:hypothetical protein